MDSSIHGDGHSKLQHMTRKLQRSVTSLNLSSETVFEGSKPMFKGVFNEDVGTYRHFTDAISESITRALVYNYFQQQLQQTDSPDIKK